MQDLNKGCPDCHEGIFLMYSDHNQFISQLKYTFTQSKINERI